MYRHACFAIRPLLGNELASGWQGLCRHACFAIRPLLGSKIYLQSVRFLAVDIKSAYKMLPFLSPQIHSIFIALLSKFQSFILIMSILSKWLMLLAGLGQVCLAAPSASNKPDASALGVNTSPTVAQSSDQITIINVDDPVNSTLEATVWSIIVSIVRPITFVF